MLPNGSTIIGKKAKTSTTDQSHDESDGYYLGRTYYIGDSNAEVWNQNVNYPYSNNMLKYLGPEAFDEYGNFAMYAGTDSDGIRFGVRMDGTVYCSRL